ncbi:hypothetical protein Syun_029273 [Stephania yunnanensis]|uniref:Uncharacterized protein n=1 Tax=Stephania yunnanensis TaxID=152371 RepID=A0AAP0HH61_9MAGN
MEEEGGQTSHIDQRDTTEEVEAAAEGLAALNMEESGHEAGDRGMGAGRSAAEVSREEVAADQRSCGKGAREQRRRGTSHLSGGEGGGPVNEEEFSNSIRTSFAEKVVEVSIV